MSQMQKVSSNEALVKDLPILIVYFNRPQQLELLLRSLKKFSPPTIYFSCDGPRQDNPSDIENIIKCDQLIKQCIDWNCATKFLKADRNYGCDNWVPRSITWLFESETQGLILEDDCIIDFNFYQFANELLQKYENVDDIMSISALSLIDTDCPPTSRTSYHYSCYPLTWGWATWKRAWENYQSSINSSVFNPIVKDWLVSRGFKREEIKFWTKFFLRLQNDEVTYWDAKWIYSIWMNKGLSITPNVNFVKNVGFGMDATHTKASHDIPKLEIASLSIPLIHPCEIVVNSRLDRKTFIKKFKFTFKKKILLIKKIITGVFNC